GFVYTTDAATRPQQVKGAFRPAEDTYRSVLYPVAVVAGTKRATLAQAFLDLLLSREGQATLGRLGFQPPPARVRGAAGPGGGVDEAQCPESPERASPPGEPGAGRPPRKGRPRGGLRCDRLDHGRGC